ncbi:AAEL013743-PA [Aedes aegypti]|uniref:AAEL013743-PA n=1 Tax=Aedes aegypti TaxID=7159 RepID=Q16IA5_AEDAE|nr:AAEL013743-PA [Aedes aegypti]
MIHETTFGTAEVSVQMKEKYFVEESDTWEMEKVAAKEPSGVDTMIAQFPTLAHIEGCSHQDNDFIDFVSLVTSNEV